MVNRIVKFGCSADDTEVYYQLVRMKDNWVWQGNYFTATATFLPMNNLGNCEWGNNITINQYNLGRFPTGNYLLKFYKGADKVFCSSKLFSL